MTVCTLHEKHMQGDFYHLIIFYAVMHEILTKTRIIALTELIFDVINNFNVKISCAARECVKAYFIQISVKSMILSYA